MLKIAIEKEAATVRIPRIGDDTVVSTIINAAQLIILLGQSRELRWILPADGKWWVWQSYELIHSQVAEFLGYDMATTLKGYIYDEDEPGHMSVSWYTGKMSPLSNERFMRVMSDEKITVEPAYPPHGQTVLKPSDVRQPAEVS